MAGKRISTSRRINQKGKKSKCAETVRAETYKIISENPGISFSEIESKVKRGNGTVSYHLYILQRGKKIVSRVSGRRRLYWAKDFKGIPVDNHLSPVCCKIIDVLRNEQEGLPVGRIADKLEMSHPRICYHLHKMELDGIVKRERRGRKTMCYLRKNLEVSGDS